MVLHGGGSRGVCIDAFALECVGDNQDGAIVEPSQSGNTNDQLAEIVPGQ
jgi:hypothetical protein